EGSAIFWGNRVSPCILTLQVQILNFQINPPRNWDIIRTQPMQRSALPYHSVAIDAANNPETRPFRPSETDSRDFPTVGKPP
ncbi:MAG: hypothetical protein P5702_25855, partial [Limnospira sp. PMC 1291.21]|uniref:hypothetical protein n=1 Tax=Limnospira sp. PMC 1291.21 TaxID=2981074 RepID=UPI0028E14974